MFYSSFIKSSFIYTLLFYLFYCPHSFANEYVNSEATLHDLQQLSSDKLQGRKVGTTGSLLAQSYIISHFRKYQLQSFSTQFQHPFFFLRGFSSFSGTNLVGYLEGREYNDKLIVITAHYDHLGGRSSHIYNGANDNASGVAALLNLARYFSAHQPAYNLVFVATDAEESGLQGAKALIDQALFDIANVVLNINLDMLAHGTRKRTLYVAGTKENKQFKPLIKRLSNEFKTNQFKLRMGHDNRSNKRSSIAQSVNWKNASDHAVFRKLGIPYLYFGVEINQDYHSIKDTFERIQPDFYIRAVTVITKILDELQQLQPEEFDSNFVNLD